MRRAARTGARCPVSFAGSRSPDRLSAARCGAGRRSARRRTRATGRGFSIFCRSGRTTESLEWAATAVHGESCAASRAGTSFPCAQRGGTSRTHSRFPADRSPNGRGRPNAGGGIARRSGRRLREAVRMNRGGWEAPAWPSPGVAQVLMSEVPALGQPVRRVDRTGTSSTSRRLRFVLTMGAERRSRHGQESARPRSTGATGGGRQGAGDSRLAVFHGERQTCRRWACEETWSRSGRAGWSRCRCARTRRCFTGNRRRRRRARGRCGRDSVERMEHRRWARGRGGVSRGTGDVSAASLR